MNRKWKKHKYPDDYIRYVYDVNGTRLITCELPNNQWVWTMRKNNVHAMMSIIKFNTEQEARENCMKAFIWRFVFILLNNRYPKMGEFENAYIGGRF